jgi:hypothetical protein
MGGVLNERRHHAACSSPVERVQARWRGAGGGGWLSTLNAGLEQREQRLAVARRNEWGWWLQSSQERLCFCRDTDDCGRKERLSDTDVHASSVDHLWQARQLDETRSTTGEVCQIAP